MDLGTVAQQVWLCCRQLSTSQRGKTASADHALGHTTLWALCTERGEQLAPSGQEPGAGAAWGSSQQPAACSPLRGRWQRAA